MTRRQARNRHVPEGKPKHVATVPHHTPQGDINCEGTPQIQNIGAHTVPRGRREK